MHSRRMLLISVLSIAIVLLLPRDASAQAPRLECPPPGPEREPSGWQVVSRALSQDRLAWFRRKYSLTNVKPADLRRLTEARSSSICARLNAYYDKSIFGTHRFRRSYYRADEFYFAAFIDTRKPASGTRLHSHFALFDSQLRLRATLAPK